VDAAEIQNRTRAHLIAFAAVLAMALVAGGLAMAGVSNVDLVLAIAAVQGVIVLTAMMHARSDGPWVRGVLFFAALFVAVLFGALVLGHRSTITGTERLNSAPAAVAADSEAH